MTTPRCAQHDHTALRAQDDHTALARGVVT
jgi:hypothetical protein